MTHKSLGIAAASIVLATLTGCGPSTPQERLTGRWVGTPEVREAVDAMVQQAAPGQEVNPLAQGAARFLGKALAKATMSVELDLRPSGAVFVHGNTELLGLPPDCDGTWQVISADQDRAVVEFDIDDKTIRAKLVLRDADEFMLKLEEPKAAAAAPAAAQPSAPEQPPSTPAPAATNDDNKTYEDDDPPAKPATAAPVAPSPTNQPASSQPPPNRPAQPVAAKPGEKQPDKQPPAAILFKRSSS